MKKLIILLLVVSLMPLNVFAAAKPYKDVSKKSVGKDALVAITAIKGYGGYNGVVKGKKFYPQKKATRNWTYKVLKNLYGKDKVPSRKNLDKKATPRWLTSLLVAIAEKIGIPITWDDNSKKALSRALCSQYIKVFIDFDSAFKPGQSQ